MTIRSGDVVSQMRKKKGVGEDSSLSLCLSLFLSLSLSDEEEEGCGGGFIFLRGKTPSVQPSQSRDAVAGWCTRLSPAKLFNLINLGNIGGAHSGAE